ncbi:MAG: hypothetical protein KDC12_06555 [Flavobacteriales bacterium]|nr:hypothetical protein [Flavobacteriales bacterium]
MKSLFTTCIIAFLLTLATPFQAQLICGLQNADHSMCCDGLQAIEEDMFTFIPPPANFVPGEERSVIINVTYNNFTTAQQTAFAYAVDIWATNLTSSVPIQINATMTSLGGSTLGFAGPVTIRRNFAGAPLSNTWYPIALANQLAGSDLATVQADITCTFNTDFNWYYGTDGNTPGGQYDFVSVVLHELGHGLGFVGSANVSGGVGTYGQSGSPYVYDTFVEEGDGTDITSYTSGTTALAGALTSNSLYWNGAFGMSANGGTRPRLYAPTGWNAGSSYSHLNEATYPSGNANSLMTPFLGSAEAIHDPGPITYGMFTDMAWQVGGCEITDVIPLTQFPCNPANNTYTQQIQVVYDNAPASGSLTINGINYPILSSPQTVTLTGLPADGQPVDFSVSFSTDGNCTYMESNVVTAPEPCCLNDRIIAVDTDLKQITIHNFGGCTVDYTNYELCSDLVCESVGNMTLVSGALVVGSGASMTVQWDAWSPAAGGTDLDLYTPSPVYTDPTDLQDFVQWGSGGNGREAVAVAAGIWTAGTFITDVSPFSYIGNGTQNGVNFWDGTPPPCTITNAVAGLQGICDGNNEYIQEVGVYFTSGPSTGTIVMNGQSFPVGSSPIAAFLGNLPADGQPVDLTVYFSDDPGCTTTFSALFTAPVPCVSNCPTDFNGDNVMDIVDLLFFLGDFGCVGNCVADLNNDGHTDAQDLLLFLPLFGVTCP